MRFELPIVSGVPSNRYCRTSRVVLPGLTTDVCSMAVFGSCDAEPLGVILHMVPTPLATTVLFLAAGVWGRIIEALSATHDAVAQMIDTSIVCVHQHGACITRNQRRRWEGHAAA